MAAQVENSNYPWDQRGTWHHRLQTAAENKQGRESGPILPVDSERAACSSYLLDDENMCLDSDSDIDSLFDEPQSFGMASRPARRTAPPIPGLFFPPVNLPADFADETLRNCLELYFCNREVNQVMLFGRSAPATGDESRSLPRFLTALLATLAELLRPLLPSHTYTLLFPDNSAPPKARQVILNLYNPGEGISPHVDLLNRFGDGIIGVSLGSGCVMNFESANQCAGKMGDERATIQDTSEPESNTRWDLYLPERSVIVLSEEARYGWTHGIEGRKEDFVESGEPEDGTIGHWIVRGSRLSITFRWLLPGADIVGGPA